ncbi:MAG: hypothetical protein ACMZ64_11655 [Oleiphilus sp.]
MNLELITQESFSSLKNLLIEDGVYRENDVMNHHQIEVEVYSGILLDGQTLCFAQSEDEYFNLEFNLEPKPNSEAEMNVALEDAAYFLFSEVVWRALNITTEKDRAKYGELTYKV